MSVTEEIEKAKKVIKAADRRAHLKLSLEERRRQLSKQAEKIALHYEKTKKRRENWQGGDIFEF